MFSRIKNFVVRHRRKFIVGGVVIGGVYLASHFFHKKLLDLQHKEDLKAYFIRTEEIGRETIVSLSPALKERIVEHVDVQSCIDQLKNADETNRYNIWSDMKVRIFTELFTIVYAGAMLVLVIRTQVNIMAGYKSNDPTSTSLSSEDGKEYLSLCQHFINRGVYDLHDVIRRHTTIVMNEISLKDGHDTQDLQRVFRNVVASISRHPEDPIRNITKFLFPEQSHISQDSTYSIKCQTIDALSHDKVKSLVREAISDGFTSILNHFEEAYNDVKVGKVPLAKLIPRIHTFVKDYSTNNNKSDFWIQPFLDMDKFQELSLSLFQALSC